jgi:hypothetical protein
VSLLNCFESIGMRATAFEGAALPVWHLPRAYLRQDRSGSSVSMAAEVTNCRPG